MADCDTLKASNDLRFLKTQNLFISRGKGKATYYIAGIDLNTPPPDLNTPPPDLNTPPLNLSAPPLEILDRIKALNKREHDKGKIETIILDLCNLRAMKASEIAGYFQKEESYFKRKYLSNLISEKRLKYLHPEMINHPEQAYLTNNRA